MTQTEALRLALEALENMANIRDCQREKGYPLSDADKRMQKAITAIKAALEAKDEPAPVAKNEGGRITWMIDDWPQNCLLYTHLPKQEAKDEPVGSFMTRLQAIDFLLKMRPQTEPTEKQIIATIDAYSALFGDMIESPTPTQRKPLTDEELRNHYQSNEWLDGVRFAEQFHGIKGEA